MGKSLNLTAQDILNKEFKTDFKGYNSAAVDKFLDVVIEDYQIFDSILFELNSEITRLKVINNDLKHKLNGLEAQSVASDSEESKPVTNLDILLRISNLEKEVFKNR